MFQKSCISTKIISKYSTLDYVLRYNQDELNSTSGHSFHRFRADAIFFRHAWRIREAYKLAGADHLNSSRTILVVMKNDRGDESTAITGLRPTRGNGWEPRDLFTRRDDSSGESLRRVYFQHLVRLFVSFSQFYW